MELQKDFLKFLLRYRVAANPRSPGGMSAVGTYMQRKLLILFSVIRQKPSVGETMSQIPPLLKKILDPLSCV